MKANLRGSASMCAVIKTKAMHREGPKPCAVVEAVRSRNALCTGGALVKGSSSGERKGCRCH